MFSHVRVPSLGVCRAVAVAAVITQAAIAVTGSVVRVTGSGLGCPTWPRCFPGSLTPVPNPEVEPLTQWVEFGNRLLAPVVGLAAVACLLLAALVRRRRLVALAAGLTLGTVLQALIGGITVRTGLTWWTVSVHFLVSVVLVWLAVLLVAGFGEADTPPRWVVTAPLRGLLTAMVGVLGGLLVAGTLVTAAGPHAGDVGTPRLDVAIPTLAAVHADLVIGYLGLLAGLGFALRAVGTAGSLWRRYALLVLAVLAQGILGAAQYATGVPEVLVSLHVLGAMLVVIAQAGVWAGARRRGPHGGAPDAGTASPAAAANRNPARVAG